MLGGKLLTAWLAREGGIEAEAGATMVAAFLGAVHGTLTKK